jgi:RimJ/RimL family protein N-acetyltransferase
MESARLRLRPLEDNERDAAFILAIVNDPEWLRFIGDRKIHDLASSRTYIEGTRAMITKYGHGMLAVDRVDDAGHAVAIGTCGLLKRDTLEHPDIGYAFLAAHTGHGYAREAVTALLASADAAGVERVLAIVKPDNERSKRVLAFAGFSFMHMTEMNGESLELHQRARSDAISATSDPTRPSRAR